MNIKIIFFTVITLLSIQSFSQTSIDKIVKLDAIPTDLMFDMLDIPDAKITKPGSVKDFMASIQTFSSINGKLNTGIGLSISGQLFNNMTLDEYMESYWKRVWSNSQFSVGTAPSLNSDSSLNWGLGVRIQFINSGDGRLDPKNIKYLEDIAEDNFESVPIPEYTGNIVEDNKNLDTVIARNNRRRHEAEKKALQETKKLDSLAKTVKESKPNWNATSLNLNAGIVFRSSQSKLTESGFDKYKVWINGSYGASSFIQFIGQVGFFHKKSIVTNGEDSTKGTGALMIRVGSPNFRIGVGTSISDFNTWNGVLSFAGEVSTGLASTWLVFSLDRNYQEGNKPSIWIPNAGIKTSVGTNWIF